MTYRDETETLRAELDRARAELAALKCEPREIEVIAYKDGWGSPHAWTIIALGALLIGAALCVAAFRESKSTASCVFYALGAVAQSGLAAHIAYRILPREKVKR